MGSKTELNAKPQHKQSRIDVAMSTNAKKYSPVLGRARNPCNRNVQGDSDVQGDSEMKTKPKAEQQQEETLLCQCLVELPAVSGCHERKVSSGIKCSACTKERRNLNLANKLEDNLPIQNVQG